jgi:hypothetical protein
MRSQGLLGDCGCDRQTALPVGVEAAMAERLDDMATAAARGAPSGLIGPA